MPVEGCVCDDGFVASGESCVPIDGCGCIIEMGEDDAYVEAGTKWMADDCRKEYTCNGGGTVSSEDLPDCHKFAECSDRKGALQCTCKDGFNGDGYNCWGK